MKDLEDVANHLGRMTADIEGRFHLRADGSEFKTVSTGKSERLRGDTASSEELALAELLEVAKNDVSILTVSGAEISELIEVLVARQSGARQPNADQLATIRSMTKDLEALFFAFSNGGSAMLALSAKVKVAEASRTLAAKPKGMPAVDPRPGTGNGRHPLHIRFDEFSDGLVVSVQRAIEPNGVISRSAETLIGSLVTLVPGKEGEREVYQKSQVPNGLIGQLGTALEIAGRDFAVVLGDHFEVFWRTGILPNILNDLNEAKQDPKKFSAAEMHELFASEHLFEAIHKATDDFALRMRSGGVSAITVPMPGPVSGMDVLKSAVRYPMQFVALLTYLILPILAYAGLAGNGGASAVLKGLIPFLLPALVTFAFVQARALRRAAAEGAVDAARRQLRAETAKTVREVGDAISAAYRAFLSTQERRVEQEVIGAAIAARKADRRQKDSLGELERTAINSRLKALVSLQSQFQSSLDDAAKGINDTLKALTKMLKPKEKSMQAPSDPPAAPQGAAADQAPAEVVQP
jgi:hypothetical protein